MVSIQSVIYKLCKSTNVFLFRPLTQMPQIRRNLCSIRKSPLLLFSRLFVAIQRNGHGSPRSVFLTVFPLVSRTEIWLYCELHAVGSQSRGGRGEERNITCEPAAHQLTIAASCPGLTPFQTHEPGCIAVCHMQGQRGVTLRDISRFTDSRRRLGPLTLDIVSKYAH